MTPDEQLQLVRKHYSLNAAQAWDAAATLLTDDFSITIPPFQPFAGVYRGKTAFQELIPRVAQSIGVSGIRSIATTVGDGYAVEITEFAFTGYDGPPIRNAEVIEFRGEQICQIQPFYSDPDPWIAAATAYRTAHGASA
jgi:ketosteroid isomerase-like protein